MVLLIVDTQDMIVTKELYQYDQLISNVKMLLDTARKNEIDYQKEKKKTRRIKEESRSIKKKQDGNKKETRKKQERNKKKTRRNK